MKIVIGSDHAGFQLKERIKKELIKNNSIFDVGTSSEERADYPDYAHLAVETYKTNNSDRIILICGSGNGIQMAANKHKGVRCALCWNVEIVKLARQHNDANAISLPARFISEKEALKIVNTFLNTSFEAGRHELRTKKINAK